MLLLHNIFLIISSDCSQYRALVLSETLCPADNNNANFLKIKLFSGGYNWMVIKKTLVFAASQKWWGSEQAIHHCTSTRVINISGVRSTWGTSWLWSVLFFGFVKVFNKKPEPVPLPTAELQNWGLSFHLESEIKRMNQCWHRCLSSLGLEKVKGWVICFEKKKKKNLFLRMKTINVRNVFTGVIKDKLEVP